jgi:hypothetical protein
MSWKKHVALVTSAVLFGAVAMANGCTTTTIIQQVAADGGGESGVIITHKEAGGIGSGDDSSSGGDDSGAFAFDGTTGKACTSDADCLSTNPGAPGLVRCSLTLFTDGAVFPSGVCLMPPVQSGNCSSPNDGLIHFCDGADDQGSPGVCLPLSTGSAVGNCYPQCVFSSDATAATGCVGKNACSAVGFGPDANNPTAAVGVGFCFGGCEVDSDCPSGNHCQTNVGLCLTTLTTQLPEGQACTQPATSNSCNCLSNTGTTGFCGLACVTAGSVGCPTGQVCDAFLPTSIPASGGAPGLSGWTTQNPGMAGFCLQSCSLDGGAGTEAGACYPTSSCVPGTAVGPDCAP